MLGYKLVTVGARAVPSIDTNIVVCIVTHVVLYQLGAPQKSHKRSVPLQCVVKKKILTTIWILLWDAHNRCHFQLLVVNVLNTKISTCMVLVKSNHEVVGTALILNVEIIITYEFVFEILDLV